MVEGDGGAQAVKLAVDRAARPTPLSEQKLVLGIPHGATDVPLLLLGDGFRLSVHRFVGAHRVAEFGTGGEESRLVAHAGNVARRLDGLQVVVYRGSRSDSAQTAGTPSGCPLSLTVQGREQKALHRSTFCVDAERNLG